MPGNDFIIIVVNDSSLDIIKLVRLILTWFWIQIFLQCITIFKIISVRTYLKLELELLSNSFSQLLCFLNCSCAGLSVKWIPQVYFLNKSYIFSTPSLYCTYHIFSWDSIVLPIVIVWTLTSVNSLTLILSILYMLRKILFFLILYIFYTFSDIPIVFT